MKKTFVPFSVTNSVEISSFSNIIAQYIEIECEVIASVRDENSFEQKNIENLIKYFIILKESSIEFHTKVIINLFNTIHEFNRISNPIEMSNYITSISKHLEDKDKLLKKLEIELNQDTYLKKLELYVTQIFELNSIMKIDIELIQELIYMEIEAKSIFKIIQKLINTENIEFDLGDYWFDDRLDKDNKNVLYITTKELSNNITLEKVYSLEKKIKEEVLFTNKLKEKMRKDISQIIHFNDNAVLTNFFKRVSFI